MNIVFYVLIIAFAVFLWFILAFLFQPIGKIFYRLWDDVQKEMKNEKED